MSIEERFTEDEIFLLTNTPTLIGTVMAFAEGSGLGTIKEMFASSKSFINGIKQYPNNEIITGILPAVGEFKEAMGKAKEMREKSLARLKEQEINSSEKLRDQLIEDSKAVAILLDAKATPEEASEYKEWSMIIAENVAKAAKEGGFLGFGGTQISAGEKDAFAQIADALGTRSHLV
ncbi:MAG: hypothetical protein V3U84_09175 [Thiotrichaceae bacterium]